MAHREKERVTVRFDCIVTLGDERKRCTIQNMSREGVLTLWPMEEFVDTRFRLGDRLLLEIRLSEHKQFGTKGLSCVGTVVRIAVDCRQVAFRISRARLGAIGNAAFPQTDPRSQYVM